MFSICATKKLADHLGIKLEPAPGNAITQLGCWYANRLYVQGRQHVIFVSEATLLPVIVPAAPAKTIVPRFVHQLGMVLRELGVDEASIAIETASMNTVTWAKRGRLPSSVGASFEMTIDQRFIAAILQSRSDSDDDYEEKRCSEQS